MFYRWLIGSFVVIQACATVSSSRLEIQPTLLESQYSCQNPKSNKQVWIVQEWEVPVKLDTHADPSPYYPHTPTQLAIYRQLDLWIQSGKVQGLYGANCFGELGPHQSGLFHGWSYADLEARRGSAELTEVLTYAPFKIKAKYGDAIRVDCLETQERIEQFESTYAKLKDTLRMMDNHAALSRALAKNSDEQIRLSYKQKKLIGEIQIILPDQKIQDWAAAGSAIRAEYQRRLSELKVENARRADEMAAQIASRPEEFSVLVVGLTYGQDLIRGLESRGVGCRVLVPKGLDRNVANRLSVLEGFGQAAAAAGKSP